MITNPYESSVHIEYVNLWNSVNRILSMMNKNNDQDLLDDLVEMLTMLDKLTEGVDGGIDKIIFSEYRLMPKIEAQYCITVITRYDTALDKAISRVLPLMHIDDRLNIEVVSDEY